MTVVDTNVVEEIQQINGMEDMAYQPVEIPSYVGTLYGDIILCGERNPESLFKEERYEIYNDFISEAVDACSEENPANKDEEIFDQERYVEVLQDVIFGLLTQNEVLIATLMGTIVSNAGNSFKKIDVGVFRDTFVKKMVSYAFCGKEPKLHATQQRFYTINDFDKCMEAYSFLPPELQPRAAEWLQTYSGNSFKNEFFDTPLPGTTS